MAANPVVPTPELTFQTERTATETIVRCTGKVNATTSGEFQSTLRSLLPGMKRLVIDLTEVHYMDSSGLGALVSVWLSARRAGCELKLVNLNQRLKELLRITKLGKVFEGHEEYLGMTPD